MKFRRVQANKGMQPKRAKGQHWATKFSWSSNLFFCRSWKSTVPLLLALGAHEGLLGRSTRSAADYVYSLSWFNSNTLHVHWCYHDILSRHETVETTGCLSLHSRQTAMLPHVGTLNSARPAFSTFHSTFIREIGSVFLRRSFNWK